MREVNTASSFFFLLYFITEYYLFFFLFIFIKILYYSLACKGLLIFLQPYYIWTNNIYSIIFFFFVICRIYFYQPLSCNDSLSELERMEWETKQVHIKELNRRNLETISELSKANFYNAAQYSRTPIIPIYKYMPNLAGTFEKYHGLPYTHEDRNPETRTFSTW